MAYIVLTKDNFDQEVLRTEGTVLVDFWASWCGPCMALAPTIDEIASEQTVVKVGKVNVDEQPELAGRFGIMSIPTLMVMKDGRVVNQALGARPKSQILALL